MHDTYLKWLFAKNVGVTLPINKQTDDQHRKIEKYFKSNQASQLKC